MSRGPESTESGRAGSEEILGVVRELITGVIGEDYVLGLDIGPETTFGDDLEMESIEFVALAEALSDRYGERVDFVAWVADMELDDLINMTVGRLVDFVSASLAGDGPGGAGG